MSSGDEVMGDERWGSKQVVIHFPLPCLSPSNRDDDFQRIAVGQCDLVELAARDDFAVALQRDALAPEFQFFDEAGNIQRAWERPRLAVDRKCNHFREFGWPVSMTC